MKLIVLSFLLCDYFVICDLNVINHLVCPIKRLLI